MVGPGQDRADVIVIFGITGDLARKMTFDALYRLERRGLLTCPVVGVAREQWSDDALRTHARECVEAGRATVHRAVLDRLCARLSMVSGEFSDEQTYARVAKAIAGRLAPLFYLEIPPALFGRVVEGLGAVGVTAGARVVVEKPFGHDLASARLLNADLRHRLDEHQIFRLDHFLGKEPVMEILWLRFANSIIEPLWNRDSIAAVQITMTEDFGVEDRGSFYDAVGALRDVVQNHLLQIVGLVASEPPSSDDADSVRDKLVDVFRVMPAADPRRCVRGQYVGYLDVPGVAAVSQTETFVALRLAIENWRWSGVPFFIRAGKALATEVTEVRIVFKRPPRMAFMPNLHPDPNQLVLRIDPEAGAQLMLEAKIPGERRVRTIDWSLTFETQLGEAPLPYERLLGDAIAGNGSLFARVDSIEETWRVVQPLLDDPPPIERYAPGSWGPSSANRLVAGTPKWHEPWLPAAAPAGPALTGPAVPS